MNVNGKSVKKSSSSRERIMKVVLKKLLKNFHKLFTNFQSIFDQNEYDIELFNKFWIIKVYHNLYLRKKLLFGKNMIFVRVSPLNSDFKFSLHCFLK